TINPLYRDVLKHYGTVPLPCRAAWRTPIARAKWRPECPTPRRRRLKDCVLRIWRRHRRIWTTGKSDGPIRASTAPPNVKEKWDSETMAINYLTHHSASARLPSELRCRRPSGRGRSVALHDVGCGGY